MSAADFERFRELVLREPELQRQLAEWDNFRSFLPAMLRLAQERGCEVTEMDVQNAWQAAQRAWIERWL